MINQFEAVSLAELLCREASENILTEMGNAEPYTLTQYLDQLRASSLTYSGVCLTFDQINDLLCAQTANVLRDVANDPLAPPALRQRSVESIDSLNRERQSHGRAKV